MTGNSPPALWQLDHVDILIADASHHTLIWLMGIDFDWWLTTYGRVHDLIETLEEAAS